MKKEKAKNRFVKSHTTNLTLSKVVLANVTLSIPLLTPLFLPQSQFVPLLPSFFTSSLLLLISPSLNLCGCQPEVTIETRTGSDGLPWKLWATAAAAAADFFFPTQRQMTLISTVARISTAHSPNYYSSVSI